MEEKQTVAEQSDKSKQRARCEPTLINNCSKAPG